MKTAKYIISLFLLSFFIISCEKEEIQEIDPYCLHVKLNGEYWMPYSFNAMIHSDNNNLIAITGIVNSELGL